MTSNARRGQNLNAEKGGRCATAVGKETARILANREPITVDRLRRMYTYLQRAETYYNEQDPMACGTISYLMWGGLAAKRWSEARWAELQKTDKNEPRTFTPMTTETTNPEVIQPEGIELELRNAYGEAVETRTMEVRAAADESGLMVLEGYAARFNETTDLGYFKEQIQRGAFDGRLEDDVRYLLNHKGMPMARTANGTLKLEVREEGLWTRAVLNDTQQSRDVYAAVKRGDISSMSFAFTVAEDSHDPQMNLRTVTRVGKIYDVSPVSFPAYPTTTIQARAQAMTAPAKTITSTPTAPEPRAEMPPAPLQEQPTTTNIRNQNPQTQNPMNLNDLKGQRAAYYEEFVAIGQLVDAEGRAMTEAEQERADKLDQLIKDTDIKIRHKQREQDMVARVAHVAPASKTQENEVRAINHRFSLSAAIRSITNGDKLEGAEAEWVTEAHREMRSMGLVPSGNIAIPGIALRAGAADNFQATATGDGSGFVPTAVPFAIEALRAPSVIQTLGAVTINATGNLKFPRISVPAGVTEEDEVSTSAGAGMEMDEVNMTPVRISTYTTYSKQLVLQGGPEVDRIIANDIAQAMTTKIDVAAFAKILAASGVNDQSTSGANTTLSAAVALAMEAAVLNAGGDLNGCAYVMSPKAYAASKTLARVSSVNPLFNDQGQFNGYRAVATKHLPNAAGPLGQMIFGNFAQGLILAFFSGLDILVDPYTAARNAQITLHVNRSYDVEIRQPGAFSIVTDLA